MTLTQLYRLQRRLAAVLLLGLAGAVVADEPALDITITVMQPGETPAGLLNRIELPPLDALDESGSAVSIEAPAAEVNDLSKEVQQTINTRVSDAIGTGELERLPQAVKEVLDTDVVELPDEVVDELVDDLIEADVDVPDASDLADSIQQLGLDQTLNDAVGDAAQQELNTLEDELPVDALEQLRSDDVVPQLDGINGL